METSHVKIECKACDEEELMDSCKLILENLVQEGLVSIFQVAITIFKL